MEKLLCVAAFLCTAPLCKDCVKKCLCVKSPLCAQAQVQRLLCLRGLSVQNLLRVKASVWKSLCVRACVCVYKGFYVQKVLCKG